MKRFRWPLQRLLDVTRQRELAAQAHLGSVNAQIQRAGQAIARRKQVLKDLLRELGNQNVQERILRQGVWMACSPGQDRQIRQMLSHMQELQSKREKALEKLTEIRKGRMSYEKLREKAHEQWKKQVGKLQQQELDEAAAIRFVLHPAGHDL
jgi:flagellar export protein FliJ